VHLQLHLNNRSGMQEADTPIHIDPAFSMEKQFMGAE
jgi:hypothetical protein